MYKTHKAGEINKTHINKQVILQGWADDVRLLGNLVFINLKDRWGVVQVMISDSNKELLEIASKVRIGDVLEVSGLVSERKVANPNMPTGQFEIITSKLIILAKTEQLPFTNKTVATATDETRARYRYLELRSPNLQSNLNFRFKVLLTIRNYLSSVDFIEIETPILTKTTPEGARDYLVPSRNFAGQFYALPQSPQIYKQITMVAGFEKYFQIARCFRDEDLRSDRQPEFTQLDIETSFHSEVEIRDLTEKLIKAIWKEHMKDSDIDYSKPFETMTYDHAMDKYGVDKPDMRFDLQIQDLGSIFKNIEIPFIKKAIAAKEIVNGLVFEGKLDKAEEKELLKIASDLKLTNIAFIELDGKKVSSSLAKFLDDKNISALSKVAAKGLTTFVVAWGNFETVKKGLGAVRNKIGEIKKLYTKKHAFLWVVDFPMFEIGDDGKLSAMHHPFTTPKISNLKELTIKNALNLRAIAYDIVLNGWELGGGSIRISDGTLQSAIFDLIGLSKAERDLKFGNFIEILKHGAPPHGGLAIGIDRLVSLMLEIRSIKEVIAFPKNNLAQETMLGSPSIANVETLNELNIKVGK